MILRMIYDNAQESPRISEVPFRLIWPNVPFLSPSIVMSSLGRVSPDVLYDNIAWTMFVGVADRLLCRHAKIYSRKQTIHPLR